MTKKNRSSKRSKQKSTSSMNVTDPAVFATSSQLHSSSSSTSTSSFLSSITISESSCTKVTSVTQQSSYSSTSSKSSLKSKVAVPALTANIVEQEELIPETRYELSSNVTNTMLADIDNEDYVQNDQVDDQIDIIQSRQATIENKKCVAEMGKKQIISSWQETQHLQAYGMKDQDWVILGVLSAVTLTARMWDIKAPGEIVMDEAHLGKQVNEYLTKQFMFDRHPPLGKLLLAGITSITSKYSGTFPFEEIGDAYPEDFPIVTMRMIMALLGALCAPMAYITLKAIGQNTQTAIAATILITFDNALTANNRLMTLEAPLMFFTALSFMSWSMFTKQFNRPFSASWWSWLSMTGLAVSGALATKANGILTFFAINALAAKNLMDLASTRSINRGLFAKHLAPRATFLLLLPAACYLYVFHLHFELQINQPFSRSALGEYDLNLLTYPFRNSLTANLSPLAHGFPDPDQELMWKDVVYGSVIQLRSEVRPLLYLHSFRVKWPKGSTQQQVSGYDYPDLNTNWIIAMAPSDKDKAEDVEEIPARLRYVRHGDMIKLRHVPTRKCLHSHNVRTMGQPNREQYCELSAYGAIGMDGDLNDWWVVEIVDGEKMTNIPKDSDSKIFALETTIRFRHYGLNCYLSVTDDMLPVDIPGGAGRRELACLKDAKLSPKSIWRITLNDHDYLPIDTELASYPKVPFSKKFKELHKLMWSTPRAYEEAGTPTTSTRPLSWPIASSKSIIHVWRKVSKQHVDGTTLISNVQQISLVANPVVWWTGFLGVIGFLSVYAVITLREKCGYVSQGLVLGFKERVLNDASTLFAAWAIHFLPYIALSTERHHLTTHHYFPALYFSILLSCTLLSSLSNHLFVGEGATTTNTRLSFWIALSVITIGVFIQISPFTYGTTINLEHYQRLEQYIYRNPINQPSHIAVLEYSRGHNDTATNSGVSDLSLLFSERIKVPKPVMRERAPVLGMHYPDKNEALPREDIFMTPSQRPPQLWDIHEQKGQPNPYQRQQMQSVLEMIAKEEKDKVLADEAEDLESQDQPQQQQQHQYQILITPTDVEIKFLTTQPISSVVQKPRETQQAQQAPVENRSKTVKNSDFFPHLVSNAKSCKLQKVNEGHPYGSLDGWDMPIEIDDDNDKAKCPIKSFRSAAPEK
ncbi:hypothetical protein BGZ49_002467 [Haplosporangium sp. Z 27]|nr:hypothetical protein BGZ49_002467 [Haplosporangium sp. Z 27]